MRIALLNKQLIQVRKVVCEIVLMELAQTALSLIIAPLLPGWEKEAGNASQARREQFNWHSFPS